QIDVPVEGVFAARLAVVDEIDRVGVPVVLGPLGPLVGVGRALVVVGGGVGAESGGELRRVQRVLHRLFHAAAGEHAAQHGHATGGDDRPAKIRHGYSSWCGILRTVLGYFLALSRGLPANSASVIICAMPSAVRTTRLPPSGWLS